jgi:hypothetical protein
MRNDARDGFTSSNTDIRVLNLDKVNLSGKRELIGGVESKTTYGLTSYWMTIPGIIDSLRGIQLSLKHDRTEVTQEMLKNLIQRLERGTP